MNTDNTDEATTDATSEDIVTAESTSQRSLAIATVRQKRVYHVPEAGTFVVVGSKGDKYTVEMFPQEKCLCPSLGMCYHIIAVRMTLNLDNIDEKRVYNLTQLRKNSRKRPNKKAGKKQPRPCDEDQLSVINPAPDSAKKQSFFSSTPISTPQSILKKCKASPSIKPSAAKKICFEHLPSLSDSEQHSVQTENFTTVNDFNFTALPSSPTPVTSSATPSRLTPPQSVPVSIPSVPSPSLPSSSSPVRQSPIHRGRLWQEFNCHELTFKEKTDIKFDKKLCCQTMNFCQSVTQSQFPCITGFQNTWRVPVFENKKWIYQHKMRSQPSPSVQIHHTGCDHWITSCQDPNGTIYVLDSMNGALGQSLPTGFQKHMMPMLLSVSVTR